MGYRSALKDTQYVIRNDVRPRNVRVEPDGTVWAEFRIVPARGSVSPNHPVFVLAAGEAHQGALPQPVPAVPEDVPGWNCKPDPLGASTPAEFVDMMRRYRRWAGNPSFRDMASRVGVGSPSRFCEALKQDRLPTFALLNAFVVSLGGTGEYFQRWATAWRALDGQAPGRPVMLMLPSAG
ncbi:hypothetical protein ACOALZ_10865 [Nocardiopsis algeriensis]|uniref:hypothetical protein n=1 Tax=Nocardiopsis algeriensis TaxID=1478215 RepID=UPI003B433AE7